MGRLNKTLCNQKAVSGTKVPTPVEIHVQDGSVTRLPSEAVSIRLQLKSYFSIMVEGK